MGDGRKRKTVTLESARVVKVKSSRTSMTFDSIKVTSLKEKNL